MVEKVNPSANRPASSFKTSGAIALSGGYSNGWISQSANPSSVAVQDADITESNLNAFQETSSGSLLDVDIDGGESFIYGSWLAIDTVTTVALASSTNNQTVYVGWDADGPDDVIIGLESAFSTTSGNTDKKIPLYDFDTDGSGVTAVTDRRVIGQQRAVARSDNIYQKFEGGTVANNSFVPLQTFKLQHNEELYVSSATLSEDGLNNAAPTGINLIFVRQGDTTPIATLLSGDGATFYADESGTPFYSYTNTSGSSEVAAIAINNGDLGQTGSGDDQIAHGGFTARVIE